MKKAKLIVRILLGLMMLVFGLNKFLQFIPFPAMANEASEFMGALMKTGYIMPIVGIVEIVAGASLLLNKYTSLLLVILFPVLLNAFLFHLFLDIKGIGGALFAIGMNVFLIFASKNRYSELLKQSN